MDDPDGSQVGAHGFIQIPFQYGDGFHGVHTPKVHFAAHGGHLHLPAGVGGTALCLVGIFVFQQVNFVGLGGQLQAGILKLNAKKDEIYLLENENPYKAKGGRPAHSGREMKMTAMSSEIDLRGMDQVEAICVLDNYLDSAMRANLPSVRIIHGKGTGALRNAVQQALKRNKYVKKFRLGVYGEGEDGVTIAEFG